MEPRSEAERLSRFYSAFEMPARSRAKAYTDSLYIPCPSCRLRGADKTGNNLWLQYKPEQGVVAIDCHAGCTRDDILAAVGLTWRDMTIVPRNPEAFFKQENTSAPRPPVQAQRKPSKPEQKGKWTDEYIYRSAEGIDLYHVHRIEFDNGTKTFRQSIADDGAPRGRNFVGPDKDKKVLYRLPELMAVPKDNTVLLVEGEKDVETCLRLGRPATTMAGGAKGPAQRTGESDAEYDSRVKEEWKKSASERVGDKWLKQYTEALAGRDVVILPDNDLVGTIFMDAVAELISAKAGRVRVVKLADGYPRLKVKGDISDLVKSVGDQEALRILDELTAKAPDYHPQKKDQKRENAAPAVQAQSEPRPRRQGGCDFNDHDYVEERAWDMSKEQDRYDRLRWTIINRVRKFTVKDGSLCKWGKDGPVELCGFLCYARKMIMVHDGFSKNPQVNYVIEGWTASGTRLPELTMPVDRFIKMDWPLTDWPLMVTMSSVSTTKGAMIEAFNAVSIQIYERDERYMYMGWEKVHGKWCYLTNGSAIGADGVDSEIRSESDAMNKYGLESDAIDFESLDLRKCITSTQMLLAQYPKRISVPMISYVFLAPLRQFLCQAKVRPQMLLWFNGGYSSGKSVMAQLMLSYFGDFGELGASAPSTFKDTAANIRTRSAMIKDAIFLLDDYKPPENRKEAQNMADKADFIARAAFDGSSRGTNRSATEEGASMPARAMYMVTGEQYPDAVASAMSRMFIVNFRPGQVISDQDTKEGSDLVRKIQQLQDAAAGGWNRRVMRGYIEWLIPQIPEMLTDFKPRITRYREQASQRLGEGNHVRAAGMVAHLMLGYDYFIRYMMHVYGAEMSIDDVQAIKEERDEAWNALIESCLESFEDRKNVEPHEVFVQTLSALIESGGANVKDLTMTAQTSDVKPVNMIGYKFEDVYAFIPKEAWRAVNQQAERSGVGLGLNQEAMKKKLIESGLMKYTQMCRARLSNHQRYWVINRNIIDDGARPSVGGEQVKMDIPQFTPANDEPLPFD